MGGIGLLALNPEAHTNQAQDVELSEVWKAFNAHRSEQHRSDIETAFLRGQITRELDDHSATLEKHGQAQEDLERRIGAVEVKAGQYDSQFKAIAAFDARYPRELK